MAKRPNVLISSAGRRVALVDAFRTALGRTGHGGRVLAADMSRWSSAFHHADAGLLVPRCTDPSFVPTMLELCREHAIGLVVPTIDTELPVLAASRERFREQGTLVGVSSPETIAIAYDKVATHRWLVAEGLPTVEQATPAEILGGAPWSFPTLVKPVRGSSSIGVAIVDDPEALRRHTAKGEWVAQSIARGDEHTVDAFVAPDGTCLGTIPRRRLEVRAGEVSKAQTAHIPELEALVRRVCERLPGAFGVLNVQVFWDGQQARIIEINPRFGGGFPLSFAAGCRFPDHLLLLASGATTLPDDPPWTDGLVMLRYDAAVFRPAAELS